MFAFSSIFGFVARSVIAALIGMTFTAPVTGFYKIFTGVSKKTRNLKDNGKHDLVGLPGPSKQINTNKMLSNLTNKTTLNKKPTSIRNNMYTEGIKQNGERVLIKTQPYSNTVMTKPLVISNPIEIIENEKVISNPIAVEDSFDGDIFIEEIIDDSLSSTNRLIIKDEPRVKWEED